MHAFYQRLCCRTRWSCVQRERWCSWLCRSLTMFNPTQTDVTRWCQINTTRDLSFSLWMTSALTGKISKKFVYVCALNSLPAREGCAIPSRWHLFRERYHVRLVYSCAPKMKTVKNFTRYIPIGNLSNGWKNKRANSDMFRKHVCQRDYDKISWKVCIRYNSPEIKKKNV